MEKSLASDRNCILAADRSDDQIPEGGDLEKVASGTSRPGATLFWTLERAGSSRGGWNGSPLAAISRYYFSRNLHWSAG